MKPIHCDTLTDEGGSLAPPPRKLQLVQIYIGGNSRAIGGREGGRKRGGVGGRAIGGREGGGEGEGEGWEEGPYGRAAWGSDYLRR